MTNNPDKEKLIDLWYQELLKYGVDMTPNLTENCGLTKPMSYTAEKIVKAVEKYYKVTDIVSKSENDTVNKARQIAIYLILHLTENNIVSTARLMGEKTPSAIIYAYVEVSEHQETDLELKNEINDIKRMMFFRENYLVMDRDWLDLPVSITNFVILSDLAKVFPSQECYCKLLEDYFKFIPIYKVLEIVQDAENNLSDNEFQKILECLFKQVSS